MSNIISEEKATELLLSNYGEAQEILQNEDKLERFLSRLQRKLEILPLGEELGKIPILISLFISYARGEYRDIPIGSILAITSALLYVLANVDIIPDIIPGIGYFDDIAVVLACWQVAKDDVEEYLAWKETRMVTK